MEIFHMRGLYHNDESLYRWRKTMKDNLNNESLIVVYFSIDLSRCKLYSYS